MRGDNQTTQRRDVARANHIFLTAGQTVRSSTVIAVADALSEAREEGRQQMARYVNNFCARSPLCSRSFE